VRSLERAAYRFRDAALIAEKKDDFGSALQNLYRELERAKKLVGGRGAGVMTTFSLYPGLSPLSALTVPRSVIGTEH